LIAVRAMLSFGDGHRDADWMFLPALASGKV
jgi:hypothetical protein